MFNFENKRKMKKIVLVCIVAIMATAAQAQIYVGGTLGFSSVKTENSDAELKTTTIKLLPEIGYELDENWSIGTVVGYQYSKTGDLKTNTFTIAPYARYSFLQSDLIKLFVDGGFGFSTAKGEFYQFNLSSCIRQQNSLTAQFVSFSLANLANIFYPPRFLQ